MKKNLKYVANKLGIHISTVARALDIKTQHMVKESTREKIFELVKQEGIKPNIKARSLKKEKLTNFNLILPVGIESVFYDEYYNGIINGMNEMLLGTEFTLTTIPIESDYSPDKIFQVLLNVEMAGLILSPYCKYIEFPLNVLKKYDFPIISIDNEIRGKNIYNIVLDHEGAGYKGAKMLWDKGYRNIVLISDSKRSRHPEMRKKGFYEFFEDKEGVTIENIEFEFSISSGMPALKRIIGANKFPLCVFSLNDEIALGIVNHCCENKLRCPEDISILGFDGLSAGRYTNPVLCSMAFPFKDIGKYAADILLSVLSKKKVKKKITIEAEIKGGESC